VVVDGLEKHWERARVTASIENDHTVKATTLNVSALSFEMNPGAEVLNPGVKASVVLDGQALTVAGALTDGSWMAHFRKTGAKWAVAEDDSKVLRKRHDLQGPIDDAFMDRFIMVHPTGAPLSELTGTWAASEEAHAIKLWRTQMRGDAIVKDDTAITDADIADSNLILWGDPHSNKILGRIADKLPLQWTATTAPVMIYPNPLNPKKYVAIDTGITFREYAQPNNSLQVAYLPDYAVVDLTTPADERWPGKIVNAGFFTETWELPRSGR